MKALNKKFAVGILFAAFLAFFSAPSFAVIDVSAATTTITTDGTAAITAIGGALIALAAVAVIFKWVKGAIFG